MKRFAAVAPVLVLALGGIGSASACSDSTVAPVASDDVAATFTYLTAEEKLAHEVYTVLGEQYDAKQFDNIAASETKHWEAMSGVLDSLGIEDPTEGDPAGFFDDPVLQQMYDEFVAQGSQSLAEAAAVGIAIEEADIADLTAALAVAPDEATRRVVENQLAASKKHLAAFERLANGESGAQAGQGSRKGAGNGQANAAPRSDNRSERRGRFQS